MRGDVMMVVLPILLLGYDHIENSSCNNVKYVLENKCVSSLVFADQVINES